MGKKSSRQHEDILIDFGNQAAVEDVGIGSVISIAELARRSSVAIEQSMHLIQHMSDRVISTIGKCAQQPAEIEVRFGLKFDIHTGAVVAKAGTDAAIDVKIKWHRDNG